MLVSSNIDGDDENSDEPPPLLCSSPFGLSSCCPSFVHKGSRILGIQAMGQGATTTESPLFSSLAINLPINFSNAIIGAGNPNHKKRRKQLKLSEGGREVIA